MTAHILKKSFIRRLLPRRNPLSHKGDNGRVLIIGGSLDYYGAPLLSGLGALGSGSDLVTLLVPECNFEVSRGLYPDFIVHKYGGSALNLRAIDIAKDLMKKNDVLVIGPGLGQDPESLRIAARIVKDAEIPAVADADALGVVLQRRFQRNEMLITPHAGEFDELIPEPFRDAKPEEKQELLLRYAEQWNVTILLKGPLDYIVTQRGEMSVNRTGHPGMTVGGSGDVLSGLCGSLIAQGLALQAAAQCAAFCLGTAGEQLGAQKAHFFSATDLALHLPDTLAKLL